MLQQLLCGDSQQLVINSHHTPQPPTAHLPVNESVPDLSRPIVTSAAVYRSLVEAGTAQETHAGQAAHGEGAICPHRATHTTLHPQHCKYSKKKRGRTFTCFHLSLGTRLRGVCLREPHTHAHTSSGGGGGGGGGQCKGKASTWTVIKCTQCLEGD